MNVAIKIALVLNIAIYLIAVTNASQSKHNCIPFAHYFSTGYDLTKFDLFKCNEIGGRRAQLTGNIDCSQSDIYRLKDSDSTEYAVPGGMTAVDFETIVVKPADLYNTFDDFFHNQMMPTVSLKNPHFDEVSKGLFVQSDTFVGFAPQSGRFRMGVSEWRGSYTKLTMPDFEYRKRLTTYFKQRVASLPSDLRGNEKEYLSFIEYFGTHVMTNATFGGEIRRMTFNWSGNSEEWFQQKFSENKVNFTAIPLEGSQIACIHETGDRKVLGIMNEKRNFIHKIFGGAAHEYQIRHFDDWIDSVKKFPVLISAEMEPISSLIEDSKKSANVHEAIRIHMMTAYKNFQFVSLANLVSKGFIARNETFVIQDLVKSISENNKYNATFLQSVADMLQQENLYLNSFGRPTQVPYI